MRAVVAVLILVLTACAGGGEPSPVLATDEDVPNAMPMVESDESDGADTSLAENEESADTPVAEMITGDEAIELYDEYSETLAAYMTSVFSGDATVEQAIDVVRYLSPEILDGTVDEVATDVHECFQELASELDEAAVPVGSVDLGHYFLDQHQLETGDWLLLLRSSLKLEGRPEQVGHLSAVLVSHTGLAANVELVGQESLAIVDSCEPGLTELSEQLESVALDQGESILAARESNIEAQTSESANSAEDVAARYQEYLDAFSGHFEAGVERGESNYSQALDLVSQFDPSLVVGDIDDLAVDWHNCMAEFEILWQTVFGEVSEVNITSEIIGQTRIDEDAWLVTAERIVSIGGSSDGPPESVSAVVTSAGVGHSTVQLSNSCEPAPTQRSEQLLVAASALSE